MNEEKKKEFEIEVWKLPIHLKDRAIVYDKLWQWIDSELKQAYQKGRDDLDIDCDATESDIY